MHKTGHKRVLVDLILIAQRTKYRLNKFIHSDKSPYLAWYSSQTLSTCAKEEVWWMASPLEWSHSSIAKATNRLKEACSRQGYGGLNVLWQLHTSRDITQHHFATTRNKRRTSFPSRCETITKQLKWCAGVSEISITLITYGTQCRTQRRVLYTH